MNLRDWYLRQVVSESELDAALSDVQQADLNLAKDWDLAALDSFASPFPDEIDGGIITGLVSSLGTYPNVATTAGTAYDSAGLRIRTGSTLNVDITRQGQTAVGAGGQPTGADTDPGAGNERWISLFILFDRALSDPRVDGNNNTVNFKRDESFRFEVVVGTAKAAGTLTAADKPAMVSGKLLLADLKRSNTGFVAGSLDTTRRQDWFVRTSGASPAFSRTAAAIRLGTPRLVIEELLAQFDDHVTNTVATPGPHGRNTPFAQHAATAITYAGSPTWADGASAVSATTVEAAIDEIVTDLKATTSPAGAKLIGALLQAGTAATTGVLSLSAGTLESQLTALLDGINSRVLRTGDTVAGNLLPDATASNRTLGNAGAKWDAVLETLGVDLVSSNVVPTASGLDLGSAGSRWDVFAQAIDLTGNVTPAAGTRWAGDFIADTDATQDLGSAAVKWDQAHLNRVIVYTSIAMDAAARVQSHLLPDATTRTLGSSSLPWGGLAVSKSGAGDHLLAALDSTARLALKQRVLSTGTLLDSPQLAILGEGWDGTTSKELGFVWQTDVQTAATAWRLRLASSSAGVLTQIFDVTQSGDILPATSNVRKFGDIGSAWERVVANYGRFAAVQSTGLALDIDGPTGPDASTVTVAAIDGEVTKDAGNTVALLKVVQAGVGATAPAVYAVSPSGAPAIWASGGGATGVPSLALSLAGSPTDGLRWDDPANTLVIVSDGLDAPASSVVQVGKAELTDPGPGPTATHAKRVTQKSVVWCWGDISTDISGAGADINAGLNVTNPTKSPASPNENLLTVTLVDKFSGMNVAIVAYLAGTNVGGLYVNATFGLIGSDAGTITFEIRDAGSNVVTINSRRILFQCVGVPL